MSLKLCEFPSDASLCRRKPTFPGSLTDLHRFRKTVHGHDGSSRIVMVRKTDQRTFASIQSGKEPKLETITRETIETFRGQRTACKITTERKGCEQKVPAELIETLTDRSRKSTPIRTRTPKVKNTMTEFQSECLKAHNDFRKKHGVPPFKLNREMCSVSQDFANYLIRKNNLEHSNNQKYGENIYCLMSSDKNATIKGEDPVKEWYNEITTHDFNREPSSLKSGHFTQVIWKESKELGVAYAKLNGKIVVVANYYPPGNVISTFVKNVPPIMDPENNNEPLNTKLSNLSLSSKSKSSNRETTNNFKQECLDAHNKYRNLHGVPPLKLDEDLCKHSEEWAKICADKCILAHRKNNQYGENIYCISSTDPNLSITGSAPVDSWYEEIKEHVFEKEPHNLKSGHFTQVVWKTSELLGVGVAKRNGNIYVVANYSPAGNFVGHFTENVLPLGSISIKPDDRVRMTATQENVGFDKFELEALKIHNEYRKKHGVCELKLNKELCHYAKEWAQHCANHGMNHRPKNDYGENIFMMYSSDFSFTPSAKDAVAAWYNEIRDYSFDIECVITKALHFTQVIWKGSTELGIGMAKNNRGESFIVANYNPRGNYVGQFTANVLKPRT